MTPSSDEERRVPGSRRGEGPDSPASTDGGASGREPGSDGRGVCELCGGPTRERHCKIVCLNCGYRRDCSDP